MSYHYAATKELNRVLSSDGATVSTDGGGIKVIVPAGRRDSSIRYAYEFGIGADGRLMQDLCDDMGRAVSRAVFNTSGAWEQVW